MITPLLETTENLTTCHLLHTNKSTCTQLHRPPWNNWNTANTQLLYQVLHLSAVFLSNSLGPLLAHIERSHWVRHISTLDHHTFDEHAVLRNTVVSERDQRQTAWTTAALETETSMCRCTLNWLTHISCEVCACVCAHNLLLTFLNILYFIVMYTYNSCHASDKSYWESSLPFIYLIYNVECIMCIT